MKPAYRFLFITKRKMPFFPELERMLAKYPKAKVVWCHIGRNRNPGTWKRFSKPDGVREMILKYPNLYFDLVQSKARLQNVAEQGTLMRSCMTLRLSASISIVNGKNYLKSFLTDL